MYGFKIAGESTYIPDFSAIIEGAVSRFIESEGLTGRIIVHRAIIQLLELFALRGRGIAYAGLKELKKLGELHEKGVITLEYSGERLRIRGDEPEEVMINEVDSSIRELAMSVGGVVLTGDPVIYDICRSLGIQTIYVGKKKEGKLLFEEFFDSETMSLHLKEGSLSSSKKG